METNPPSMLSKQERSKPYRVLSFFQGEFDEREMDFDVELPYGVRGVDGQLQLVHQRREYPVMKTIIVEGQSFRVRQMDRHLLFRSLFSPPGEEALFLPYVTFADFADACRRLQPGRCLMHIPTSLKEGIYYDSSTICFYLFFNADGTGFAMHPTLHADEPSSMQIIGLEQIDFRWDDLPDVTFDVLAMPLAHLRGLCDTLFKERINPHLQMPFLEALDEIPLSWQNGSEQELQRLSRAICLTEPGLFEVQEPLTVVYRATTDTRRGGFLRVERGGPPAWADDSFRYTSRRLMSLGDLAFRLNSFSGMEWDDRTGGYGDSDIRRVQKVAKRVHVIVDPPTAHEKAEAFWTLKEWLEDKLYDSEKRARFGLPPRVLVE